MVFLKFSTYVILEFCNESGTRVGTRENKKERKIQEPKLEIILRALMNL